MSLRAEVVKLYPTALWKGVHGPCQLPLPFNSISYHHDQGQFTEDSHCAEHNSEHFAQAEALHPYKSSWGGGCYHKSLFKEKGTKAQRG